MAQRLPMIEDVPFASQLKTLNDRELLDFWEETQHLENMAHGMFDPHSLLAPDYERLIIMELQLRTCQRTRAAT